MPTLFLALAVLAATPKDLKLAAPGLSGVGLQPDYVAYFSEQLADVLTREGLRVITAKEISSLLGFDRQKQLMGCSTDASASCMAELGNALGVDGLVLGDVSKIGRTFTLSVKVVSSSDGDRLAGYAGRASSEEGLLENISQAGREIAGALRARFGARAAATPAGSSASAPSGPPAPTPLRPMAWIPTLGAGALGLASGGLYVGAVVSFNSLAANTTTYLGPVEARNRANLGKGLQIGSFVAAAAGVAALGTAAWMYFMPGPRAPLILPNASATGAGVSLIWSAP